MPNQSFIHEPNFRNVIDVQWTSRVLEGGAPCVREACWTTQALYPGEGPNVIASAYYGRSRSFEALAQVDDALAHVIRHGDTVRVRLAGQDHAALESAERQLREQLPEHQSATDEVAIEFSNWLDPGIAVATRALTVPALADIEHNYPSSVRTALTRLISGFAPRTDGRLILWHGWPGSGKTWALRALASEWRAWCRLRYIVDPEHLLAEPNYLTEAIHSRPGVKRDGDGWRLIVLEDTGELLTADAKQHAGQALSRLLNVADGLLGESSNTFFLVTTNEDLRTIHPAVSRPGRCGQVLEFGALSVEEANAWLRARGSEHAVSTPATLAELFAIKDGSDISPTRRRRVGFA